MLFFVKKIQLGGRKKTTKIKGYALIDDEDFQKILHIKWVLHGAGYAHGYDKKTKRHILMHRLILKVPKSKDVDHINHNILDNQKKNLRICTATQNMQNAFKRKFTSSKYKGVFYRKDRKKWSTKVKLKKKAIHIGHFRTEHQAALAYDLWASDLYGEFARTNFKVVLKK
jgi:hypothetical protein